mmetsp:Transcript_35884/g.78397  ORF Transcript_35884/g.78397 Transcript_35884/m.78397 type:complete len:333 (+) Transcript_35884:651-1649(+)
MSKHVRCCRNVGGRGNMLEVCGWVPRIHRVSRLRVTSRRLPRGHRSIVGLHAWPGRVVRLWLGGRDVVGLGLRLGARGVVGLKRVPALEGVRLRLLVLVLLVLLLRQQRLPVLAQRAQFRDNIPCARAGMLDGVDTLDRKRRQHHSNITRPPGVGVLHRHGSARLPSDVPKSVLQMSVGMQQCRWLASKQLQQDHSQGIHLRLLGYPSSLNVIWVSVASSAGGLLHPGYQAFGQQGKAEICQFGRGHVGVQQDILCLDIPVKNRGCTAVQTAQPQRGALGHCEALVPEEGLLLLHDQATDVPALHQLIHQIPFSSTPGEAHKDHQVRMPGLA